MNACARSPLTGAIGDSQCGGFFAAEMRSAGVNAIVFTGQAVRAPGTAQVRLATTWRLVFDVPNADGKARFAAGAVEALCDSDLVPALKTLSATTTRSVRELCAHLPNENSARKLKNTSWGFWLCKARSGPSDRPPPRTKTTSASWRDGRTSLGASPRPSLVDRRPRSERSRSADRGGRSSHPHVLKPIAAVIPHRFPRREGRRRGIVGSVRVL